MSSFQQQGALSFIKCNSRVLIGRMNMKFFYQKVILCFYLLSISIPSIAQTIVVQPNTIVSHSTTFNNVTLDMTHGSFIIRSDATLTINNSIINGTLSNTNPILIEVNNGNVVLNNNHVNIQAGSITPHPFTQSNDYFIKIASAGHISLTSNILDIDTPFTAGLLITTSTIPTNNFSILNNTINHFHGALYLVNSDNSTISGNTLFENTYGNLVIIQGQNSTITGNSIMFSGSNMLGNSIDIIDADTINISNNIISTPTCHGIYIINSNDVVMNMNRIMGGITYAFTVLTNREISTQKDAYAISLLKNAGFKHMTSSNISITNNYMGQNRYGIAAADTNTLIVQNNIFIQRFTDDVARQFWTNNANILRNISGLVWTNNLYKEAFTQDINGDNSQSLTIVNFPETGGVSL